MATLTSPGVGSNLDVKTIVSQLMTIESQPLNALASKEASFQAKLTSLGLMKSALSSLQTAAQTLNLSSTYASVKPAVADAAILGANVSGAAAAGTYNIEVVSLAQSQKLTSSGFASKTAAVGEGTLTLNVGSYSDAGTPPVTFTPKADTSATTITIDSSNNTLEGIRDAINNASAGVTATIINDGSNYRLSLTSNATGAENAVKIGVTESGSAGLAQLAYDASTGGVSNMTQNVEAKNALIKVDGISITKPSNTITDAIQGVTLNLTKETVAGTPTKLTLSRDTSATRKAIETFVTAYNNVNKQIADSTAYNASTGKGSVLTGDATIRSIQTQLRNSLSNPVSGAPAGLSSLSDVGVSFEKDGSLSIDSVKLDKILADPLKDLSKLFTKSAEDKVGIGSRVNSMISSMIFGNGALLNGRIDGLNTSVKDINTQRQAINLRLAATEERLYKQFNALDTAISRMTATSTYLTQQLDALKAQLS